MAADVRIRGAERSVHLTFDDGPDGAHTVAVLHALGAVGARATFFVTPGRAPELVRAIASEGHRVGYHCGRHIRHSWRTESDVREELRIDLAWLAETGIDPCGWRTPWGELAGWTREVAADHGLALWGWSHDTEDWSGHEARTMLTRLEETLDGGAVVLMHDGIGPGARRSDVSNTIALIEPLCAMARDRGLSTEPLP